MARPLRSCNETVTLLKPDGQPYGGEVPARYELTTRTFWLQDGSLPVEEGDTIIRTLGNGLTERYEILDRGYQAETDRMSAYYQSVARKLTEAPSAKPVPQPYMDDHISRETRRNIVDHLILMDEPFHGRLNVVDFLRRTWDLAGMPSTDPRFDTADGDIWQHMVNNSDWDDSYLLGQYLDLPGASHNTFRTFVESCVHPVVVPDQPRSSQLAADFNEYLKEDGYRLVPKSHVHGKPVYRLEQVDAARAADACRTEAYEVVLSFAGEDRAYVENVAEFLIARGVSVFYDRYEEVTLWGKTSPNIWIASTGGRLASASCSSRGIMPRKSGQRMSAGARWRRRSRRRPSTSYRHDSTTRRWKASDRPLGTWTCD